MSKEHVWHAGEVLHFVSSSSPPTDVHTWHGSGPGLVKWQVAVVSFHWLLVTEVDN